MSKDQREPYLDEDHLYHKYEMMKMANERNMADKFKALDRIKKLENALSGILEIGKRDMSNPKYDGYFNTAKEVLDEGKK